MTEIDLEGTILSFDGQVLEVFYWTKIEGKRYHLRHLKAAEFQIDKKDRGTIQIVGERPAASVTLPSFPPERFDEAQRFTTTLSDAIAATTIAKKS